jgi:hypothetical protein
MKDKKGNTNNKIPWKEKNHKKCEKRKNVTKTHKRREIKKVWVIIWSLKYGK